MQDAINEILEIMNCFPSIYKIGIIDANNVKVHYTIGKTDYSKSFVNAIELLEWCEGNLNSK